MNIKVEAISRHKGKFFNYVVWRLMPNPVETPDWKDVSEMVRERYFAVKGVGVALELVQLPNVTCVETFHINGGEGVKVYKS